MSAHTHILLLLIHDYETHIHTLCDKGSGLGCRRFQVRVHLYFLHVLQDGEELELLTKSVSDSESEEEESSRWAETLMDHSE